MTLDDNTPGGSNGPLDRPATAYTYDLDGNLTSLADPAGNETEFFYDKLDRLSEERIDLSGVGQKSRTFQYDAMNNLTRRVDRNGRKVEYDYDDLHRMTDENWYADAADNTSDHHLAYAFDLAGGLTAADDDTVDSHYHYVLDRLGRATHVDVDNLNVGVDFDVTFDDNGNRLTLAATIGAARDFKNAYAYDALDRLTRIDQAEQGGTGDYHRVAEKRVDFAYCHSAR